MEQKQKRHHEEDKKNALALKKKRLRDANDWLASTYPQCFNSRSPKPLKIGIDQDILSQGKWPYSKNFLKEILAFYTGSLFYQRALLKEKDRVSLEAHALEEVTDHQKAIAKEKLLKIEEKNLKARASNLNKQQKDVRFYKQDHLK